MSLPKRDEKGEGSDLICKTCKVDVGKEAGIKRGPVIHCEGAERVYLCLNRKPHHGTFAYYCPKCRRRLGCNVCCGRLAISVLCEPCGYFASGDPLRGLGLPMLFPLRHPRPPGFLPGMEQSLPAEDRK